jgi:hypothetical protein
MFVLDVKRLGSCGSTIELHPRRAAFYAGYGKDDKLSAQDGKRTVPI